MRLPDLVQFLILLGCAFLVSASMPPELALMGGMTMGALSLVVLHRVIFPGSGTSGRGDGRGSSNRFDDDD
jgi:uncharacterized membrane protein YagU involved in acid resistance